ncbi:MAG TPA: hypothetical protein VNS32_22345, partial [Flavisolibacter sp.]|nr:hypothetical protein [Flavisolibacter sp.]
TKVFSPDVNAYRPTSGGNALTSSYSINVTDPNFKYPQALKSTLAVDKRLPGNWIITLEANYTKNINSAFFQNVNLPTSGVILNNGGDHRTRFSSTKIYPLQGTPTSVTNPNIGNAIYMTNVNKGYAFTGTFQIQKTFRNLYLNAFYTYTRSKDVMVGGSTASTMWGSRPVSSSPNSPDLGYSEGYLPHRVVVSASYRKEYAKHFATSVGLFYEAAPAGVGSYIYGSDLNNDGFSNDLIYIPRNSSEIKLTDPSQWTYLDNFINQDKYLSKHRGEYATRNGLIYPWFKRLDMNVTQDLYIVTKSNERHTLRITIDIYNVGNLLNKNWGLYKTASTLQPIKLDKMDTDGVTPVFSVPNLLSNPSSFVNNTASATSSLLSRWQAQIGFRYLFN